MQTAGSPEHSLLPSNPDSTQDFPAVHSAQCIVAQLLLWRADHQAAGNQASGVISSAWNSPITEILTEIRIVV